MTRNVRARRAGSPPRRIERCVRANFGVIIFPTLPTPAAEAGRERAEDKTDETPHRAFGDGARSLVGRFARRFRRRRFRFFELGSRPLHERDPAIHHPVGFALLDACTRQRIDRGGARLRVAEVAAFAEELSQCLADFPLRGRAPTRRISHLRILRDLLDHTPNRSRVLFDRLPGHLGPPTGG